MNRLSRVLTTACLTGALVAVSETSAQDQPPAPIYAARAVSEHFGPTQNYIGTIIPSRRAVIGSPVDGRVAGLPGQIGTKVEAMGVLAELLTVTVELELDAAKAELELRTQKWEELKAGALPEEKLQAEAEWLEAKANADYALKRWNRIQQLRSSGSAATSDQLQAAEAAKNAADAVLKQKKAARQLVLDGPRIEQKKQAEANVAMQQATVDKLTDQVRKHSIISRFEGYVVKEHTEIGQWVKRGDPVAEVVALDEVDVVVNVLENHIPFVAKNDLFSVTVVALDGRQVSAVVHAVVPDGDPRSRTFPVRLRIANTYDNGLPELKSGMLVQVALPTQESRKRVMVPKDSVVHSGDSKMVYVVEEDSKDALAGPVKLVPVTTGVARGALVEITSELPAGSLVVTQGNERLRPGQRAQVIKLQFADQFALEGPVEESKED